MPLPSPKDNESHDEWMDRCMSNETMKDEYSDTDQRYAVCQRIWEDDQEEDDLDMSEIERRHVDDPVAEVRQAEAEGDRLEGYAALFDSETEIAGLFREKIEPGAFAESIENDDIRALFNHDPNQVLGRTTSGTLTLSEDEQGLRDEIKLPGNHIGEAVRVSVERGDITGQSFGFLVQEESWERNEDGLDLRTIEKAKLVDVGPVTYPAYEATDVTTARKRYREWRNTQEPEKTDDVGPDEDDEENTGRPASVMRKRLELIKMNAPR